MVPVGDTKLADDPDLLFAADGTHSLLSVATYQPALLKKSVEDLFARPDFLKTVFLFGFEAMGIARQDTDSLGTMFGLLLQAKSNVGKEKDIGKQAWDSVKVDFDQCAFVQTSKQAAATLRHLKRFCKLLVSGLVDLYPAKKDLLPAVIEECRAMSRSKIRLLRLSFTYFGMLVWR